MNFFSPILQKLRPMFSQKNSGGKLHRRIAIIGLESDGGEALARILFEGSGETFAALQSDDPVVASTRRDATDNAQAEMRLPRQFAVIYLTSRRIARLRRWLLYLCSPNSESNSEAPIETSWRTQADTCLIVWPYRLLTEKSGDLHDYMFPIIGAVGAAKAAGRMRRLAIVITDIPRDQGCSHPSQWRLDLVGSRIADDLGRRLREAANVPGHELADPRWQQFLTRIISRNRSFVRALETFNRTLGRSCPIFFFPSVHPRDLDTTRILAWIDHDREPSKSRHRLWPRLAVGFSALLVLVTSTLWLSIPMHPLDDVKLTVTGGSSRVVDELEARRDLYHHSPAIALLLPHHLSYENQIETTQCVLNIAVNAIGLELFRRQWTPLIISEISLGNRQTAGQLDSLVSSEMRLIEQSRGKVGNPATVSQLLTGWQYAIDRLTLLRDLAWALNPDTGVHKNLFAVLTRSNHTVQAESLFQWAQSPVALNSGQNRAFLSHDSVLYRWLWPAQFMALITRPSLKALIAAINQMSLAEAIARTTRVQLREAIQLEGETCAAPDGWIGAGRKLLFTLDSLAAPREMVVLFSRLGDYSWHVDVRTSTSADWTPSHWSGNDCVIRLEGVAIGDALSVICNTRSRNHAVTTQGPVSCTAGASYQLELTAQSGRIPFGDKSSFIEYTIVQGWPDWPSRTGNSQGTI